MHLAAYHFAGDPDTLFKAYEQLAASFPPDAVLLNLCVVGDAGITVYDACPTTHDFETFSTGAEFADGLAAVGLPTPRVESLGTIRAAVGTELASTVKA